MDNGTFEKIAEQVHIGWMQEKQRQGFADHPLTATERQGEHVACADCFIDPEKHHADMLSYADLPEYVKEYDRVTVRAVLNALWKVGYVLASHPSTDTNKAPAE